MKRLIGITLAAVFTLIGCAPLDIYYKPGANVARMQKDTTTCEVKALRDVPVSTQIRQYPPEYVPPVSACDANGNCRIVRSGFFIPGDVVAYDPNDGLRNRVEQQCMADKGYAPVSIPLCPDHIARATPGARTNRLPTLTDKSCVIKNQDGSFQIVTRG